MGFCLPKPGKLPFEDPNSQGWRQLIQNNSAAISGLINTSLYNLFLRHIKRRKYLMLISEMGFKKDTVLSSHKNQ